MRIKKLVGFLITGLLLVVSGCAAARPVPEVQKWRGPREILFPASIPHMTVVRDEGDVVQRAFWARELLRRGSSEKAAEEYERLAREYKSEDREFEREAARMEAVAWLQAGNLKRFVQATDRLEAMSNRFQAATPTPEVAALIFIRDRIQGRTPPDHVRRVLPAKIRALVE